ncbi:ras-related protein Rab-41 isoform X2 [Notolabrus celidotus]|uniref:ras-related protein Rab-41 isoform X2 n=1 Tax=Notolabrus celidotus TaxID=1203425 RepID=UPI00148F7CE0|nr:ras-related protein Rab-41 isoform X2 [Notolabrus celidotus]
MSTTTGGGEFGNPLRKFKLVFLGEQSVGKPHSSPGLCMTVSTTLIRQQLALTFYSKTMYLEDRTVRLQLWDTAGQERFRSLIPSYIRDSTIAVVVMTSPISIHSSKHQNGLMMLEQREEAMSLSCLLGTKQTWRIKGKFLLRRQRRKARELNVMYIETSAKAGYNVKQTDHHGGGRAES